MVASCTWREGTVISLGAAQIKKIGRPFLFKGLMIGTSSYFGADAATKKIVKTPASFLVLNLKSEFRVHAQQRNQVKK
jgi:hypothetical protein